MTPQPAPSKATVGPKVTSSPLDNAQYRALTLSNELRVLIASDTASDKAAAAMNVAVGNFSDPDNLPGLAHFTEHMLFLGTAKYPEEGSYSAFLAENGGYSNAYTAAEDTNFHFEMAVSDRAQPQPAPRFREALDRFAQFFTAPLFTESATDRELNAVHSEHQKNLQGDQRRVYQLKKSAAVNPAHPAYKFSTGSKETLHDIPREKGIDTRAALLAFHSEYYSANLMALCIVAPYPLDMLQSWVEELFSEIPNHSRANPCEVYADIPVLIDEKRTLVFHVQPVRDIRDLEITWQTPSYREYQDEKPTQLVTEFLGDEAEGSLLSLLKKRGWCNSLSIGHYDHMTFGTYHLNCALTVEGVDHVDDIIALIYKYIALLRKDTIAKSHFDESATLSANNFRFREREDPTNFVTHVSADMMHYPPEDYLAGTYLFRKFDPELVDRALSHLVPENSTTVISGKFVDDEMVTQRERWYGSPYHVEPASPKRLAVWADATPEPELSLPKLNPFIPTELDIIGAPLKDGETDLEGPRLVESNEYFDLHHKLDRTFSRPMAHIEMTIHTPQTYQTPLHSVLGALFTMLLDDSLMEFSYPAHKAGFHYGTNHTPRGIRLSVNGYSHRVDVLLYAIMEKMRAFKPDAKRFEMQRDSLERTYRNFEKAQPVSRTMYNIQHLLTERKWHVDEYVKAIESGQVTMERLELYVQDLLREMKIVGMVVGNVTEEQAVTMMRTVQKKLGYAPLPDSERPTIRAVRLPTDREVFMREENRNPDDGNSAIEVLYQVGRRGNPREDVKLELLAEILDKPTFHELRTVQQLGYMVFTGVGDTEGVRELNITVQSTVADPDELLDRIDRLLEMVRRETLGELTDEKMADYVNAMRSNKGEPDRSLARRARRFSAEIRSGWLTFDRMQRDIAALDGITKEDIIELFDEVIAPGGSRRRRVVAQVYCKAHSFEKRRALGEKAVEVTSVAAFRKAAELYPEIGTHA